MMSPKVHIYILLGHGYYNLVIGSNLKCLIKGKSTLGLNIKKTNPIDDNPDESLALSYISKSDCQGNKLNGSEDEDGRNDDDYNVAQMTDKEACQLLDDEVSLSPLTCLQGSERISPSCPRLQIIHICYLTMITTLTLALQSWLTASSGPAQKLHDPQPQNLKRCSTIEVI